MKKNRPGAGYAIFLAVMAVVYFVMSLMYLLWLNPAGKARLPWIGWLYLLLGTVQLYFCVRQLKSLEKAAREDAQKTNESPKEE